MSTGEDSTVRPQDGHAAGRTGREAGTPRLAGVDAARGLALIGLIAVHVLPEENDATGEPTWSYLLFAGDSAALFALLAGVGLALSTGRTRPHRGRQLAADRIGLAVRAALIACVGLLIGYAMPEDAPANGILLFYGMFFLLAIPFLSLGPRSLFAAAGVFAVVAPLLILGLQDALPDYSSSNPTFQHLRSEPTAVLAQLLLTGAYPALAYLTYILAGMGIGRLDLRARDVQARVATIGAGLAIAAQFVSWILLYAAGGFRQLVGSSPGLDEEALMEALIFEPDVDRLNSPWWLAVTTPHMSTPLSIAWSLGAGMTVLGVFLLASRRLRVWLRPLAAMGAMTLTLYSAHLVALSFEVHYDEPYLWFLVHLVVAALFALTWQSLVGQGPLEKVVGTAVRAARRAVLRGATAHRT
ncbi:heparan-alpha-glucosaminide N-acetyltransferase domain-containing protein [Kocuria oceani]|uniref:Heparan-alpha-glucosaminide N-acetyltransferase domain-containing protein n=1 Tax=Kocuria oceani TaxID=988827 RepID=A0ABV9TL63_9MICC|nr:heparan-alpha-glucosaminide N-acetyltransferase domain-containing protein [Kocuria oceani]